jgi:hypothetical protein
VENVNKTCIDAIQILAYGSILSPLSITALECDAVTLMLKPLGSDQTLNLGSLGVWLLSLALGLDLTTNNEFADLKFHNPILAHALTLCHAFADRRR